MAVKQTIRRLLYGDTPGDRLDDTPIELPAGHHRRPSAAREIQEQIAIQIALRQHADGQPEQTIAEIEAELEDLESDVYDSESYGAEYIELADEPYTAAEAAATAAAEADEPLEEGVPPGDNQEDPS